MARNLSLLTDNNGKEVLFIRNDDKTFHILITDAAGALIDISSDTAADYHFVMKNALADADPPVFDITATFVTDGTDGLLSFAVLAADLAAAVSLAIAELIDRNGATEITLAQWNTNVFEDVLQT